MNSELLTTKTVFDVSKLFTGQRIEITVDRLIRYEAIVLKVELDRFECVTVDPETRRLEIETIYLHYLSSKTRDGYEIRLL